MLTNPGERIMLPNFGVGVKQALFERSSYDLLTLLQERILDQLDLYASTTDHIHSQKGDRVGSSIFGVLLSLR